MTKALSRKYREFDAEARRAARAEARRSGRRLGEWLDEAAEDDDHYDDDDAGDRVDAVARRLARSGGPSGARARRDEERAPRRWRDESRNVARRDRDEPDDQPRRPRDDSDFTPRRESEQADERPRRWRDDAQQRRRRDNREEDQPRRWQEEDEAPPRRREPRFDVDDDDEVDRHDSAPRRPRAAHAWREVEDPIDPQEIVADAAAIVGRRIAKSERQTARALDNLAGLVEDGARSRESAEEGLAYLAKRLGRIESRLAEQSSAGDSVKPIRSALARLESRLERLSGTDRVAHVEEALDGLDRRLADIARRLESPPRKRDRAPAPETPSAPPPAPPPAPAPVEQELARRAESLSRRHLDETIAEIARRQRALEAMESQAAQPAPLAQPVAPAAPPAAARAPARPPASALPPAPPPRTEAADFAPPRQFAQVQSRLEGITQQLETARRDAAERADHHLVVMRQIESLRRDLNDMSGAIVELAPRASIAAIETALRELSRRIETQRSHGVADELLAPAERIASELCAAIKELDPGPLVRNLHADVQTIGRRLDALQQPGAVNPAAIELLVSQTQEIRSQLAGLAARPLPLEKIEARLVDLTQRVELLTRAGGGAAKAAVAFDMGEVARSIRAIVAEETSSSFDTFSGRLETLAAKLDGVVADAGGNQRFDELGKRIDDLGYKLATRIAASAAQAPPVDTASLENLVSGLAKKLDTALEQKPNAPAIEEIGRKLDALETRLPDEGAVQSLARIEAAVTRRPAEQQFADLAQRIDGVRETLAQKLEQGGAVPNEYSAIEKLVRGLDRKIESALATGATARDMEPILSQLEQLSHKVDRLDDPIANPKLGALLKSPMTHLKLDDIASRLDHVQTALAAGAKTPDMQPVLSQLEQLSHKVDRLDDPVANARLGAFLQTPAPNPKLDEIASRLDHVQMSLARRADEGARVEARQAELTDLVEQLAARMNIESDSRGDVEALRALEQQISALSQRLDRDDHNSPLLAAVEEKIGALVAQIEDAKSATTLAAEEAVRRATQEILRETSPDADALREAIERELADIRTLHDESGQRTHETLLAVHETLERVVDRLAMFEDELGELRASPTAKTAKAVQKGRAPELAGQPRPPQKTADDLGELMIAAAEKKPRRPAVAEAVPAPERAAEPVQMDFIAAARRAAQQAARDAQAAEKAHVARRAAAVAEGADGADAEAAGGKSVGLAALKRPLLLGLGAVVLMVGAYQIARIGVDGADSWRQDHPHAKVAPTVGEESAAPADKSNKRASNGDTAPSPAEPAKSGQPQAAAPATQTAPAPRMILPQGGNQPLDKTPVGSIGIGGLNPLAPPQHQDPVNVIRVLAEQGNPAAQFELAVRSAEGRGVPRDPKLAAQWFEKAAAQGLAPAQYRLGSLYEKGVGVERDHARARKLYLSAAGAGNARAMHNLAVMLAEGGDGGKPDYAGASEWFRKAGELGVRDSQFNLAILYARGLGVSQSLVQSYLWFSAAATQGDADADKKREEVGARLDSKELAAAKAAAAAFRVKEAPRAANEVAPPAGGWENVRLPTPAQKPAQKPKISVI
ncbi:MAG: peptidoglycan-binding protein [Chloroflexota bacterium]